jgi:hypothetical protein
LKTTRSYASKGAIGRVIRASTQCGEERRAGGGRWTPRTRGEWCRPAPRQDGPEAASEAAFEHDVSWSFKGSVADGAAAARFLEDALAQKIEAS